MIFKQLMSVSRCRSTHLLQRETTTQLHPNIPENALIQRMTIAGYLVGDGV